MHHILDLFLHCVCKSCLCYHFLAVLKKRMYLAYSFKLQQCYSEKCVCVLRWVSL